MSEFCLYAKNQKILESIPSEYAIQVFNAIIARAIQKGDLQEELELYLDKTEIEEIFNENQISIKQKRKASAVKEKVIRKSLFTNDEISPTKKPVKKEDSEFEKNSKLFSL